MRTPAILVLATALVPSGLQAQDRLGVRLGEPEEEQEQEQDVAPIEARLPVALARRPLTLPALALAPEAAFEVDVFEGIDVAGTTFTIDPIVHLELGARFGILDDLEAGLLLPPLILSPDLELSDPEVGALYRLLRGSLEVGAGTSVRIPISDSSSVLWTLGVPVRLHLGDQVRLDGAVVWGAELSDPFVHRTALPAGIMISATDQVFLGAQTGLRWQDFDVADTLAIPLGFGGGYTVVSPSGPLVDVGAFLRWPALYTGSDGGTHAGAFQLGAAATGYLFL